jgi:hypothetical protein
MTDHTLRLFTQMMACLERFETHAIDLRSLVDGLEGLFNALEERLPAVFYEEWYQHWRSLEEKLALSDEIASTGPSDRESAVEHARALKHTLKRFGDTQ